MHDGEKLRDGCGKKRAIHVANCYLNKLHRVSALRARDEGEIDTAYAQFVAQQVNAIVLGSVAFFNRYVDRLVGLAARHAIPTIYAQREYPVARGS